MRFTPQSAKRCRMNSPTVVPMTPSRFRALTLTAYPNGPRSAHLSRRGRAEEVEEHGAEGVLGVDGREVPRALEGLRPDLAAALGVAVEDRPDLGDHGLRGERGLPGPPWYGPEPPERSHLPRGAVGDHHVRGPVHPQHGRLGLDLDEPRPVAVLGRQGVEDPTGPGRDARPVLRGNAVAGVAVLSGLRLEDLL